MADAEKPKQNPQGKAIVIGVDEQNKLSPGELQSLSDYSKYLGNVFNKTGKVEVSSKVEINKNKQQPPALGHKTRLDLEWSTGGTYSYIEPPLDNELLSTLGMLSGHLRVVIEALVTGIYGCKYELIYRHNLSQEQIEQNKVILQQEMLKAKKFLDTMDIDGNTHITLKYNTGWNKELLGNAWWEIVRKRDIVNNILGEPYAVQLLESIDMRIGDLSNTYVMTKRPFFDGKTWTYVDMPKRLRLYVQRSPLTGTYVYFKEFGDPRIVDASTGQVYSNEDWLSLTPDERNAIPQATEVIHFKLYYPGTPYGVPRYIGTLYSILGSIYKEENDLAWFLRGCKADIVISSPYPLSKESINNIENYAKQSTKKENSRKALVLIPDDSAVNDIVGDTTSKPAEIKVTELGKYREAQFIEYDKENRENIKASARLADLHVGRNKDFNRATAEVAQENTEDTVFAPARDEMDCVINDVLFPSLGISHVIYKSIPTSRINKEIAARIIDSIKPAMTVRDLRKLGENLLGRPLPDLETKLEGLLPGLSLEDLPLIVVENLLKAVVAPTPDYDEEIAPVPATIEAPTKPSEETEEEPEATEEEQEET